MNSSLPTILLGTSGLLLLLTVLGFIRARWLEYAGESGSGVAVLKGVRPNTWFSKIENWLVEAELDWSLSAIARWLSSAVLSLVMLMAAFRVPVNWAILLVAAGLLAGVVFVIVRRSFKLQHFRNQLPEVVSVMAQTTRAGLGVEEAFSLAEGSATGRLKEELASCSYQLSLGRSLVSVLDSFAKRTGFREVGLLAAILSVQRQTGGPLPEALDRLNLLMTEQLAFRQQVKAATNGGRWSAFIIGPAAPLIFLVLYVTSPEHTSMFFDEPLGRTFLILGGVLNIAGICTVYYLLQPKR